MNSMFDILLGRPLPPEALRGLLFFTFALHMIFVLFTIGTAVLAVFYFLRGRIGQEPGEGAGERPAWLHRVMDAFLAHKSLTVVLGVAPLLLIQVAFTIPFFTAVHLFAPYWLGIILCLIVSFLTLDYVGRSPQRRPLIRTALATVGLVLLLAIPGVFVAVLAAAENSGSWLDIVQGGYRLSGTLAWHWLARYAHVVAAGIVFAGLFFAFVTGKGEDARRRALLRWAMGGLLAQLAIGVALYVSLPTQPDPATDWVLAAGIVLALALVILVWRGRASAHGPSLAAVSPVGLVMFIAMLLTRQMLQDRGVMPLNEQLNANAGTYRTIIQPNRSASLASYDLALNTPYDNPHNAYTQSCSFCHGAQADGKGIEAKNLAVAPEVLAAVRTTRPYLRDRLLKGVGGSGMPYFTIYTGSQLDALMSYLDGVYGMFDAPQAVTRAVTSEAQQQAINTYGSTCAACHGPDGADMTPVSRGLAPPPPDFRYFSLTPERAFAVVTSGYPGTAMTPYGTLPEDVRWGLVKYVTALRKY